MKTCLLGCLCLFAVTLSASAQRYICGLSGTITSRGLVGPERTALHKPDFLTMVANTGGRTLDAASLELVYDTTANQFQVVQKADGALVVVVYYVVNQKEIGVGDGSIVNARLQTLRQADLVEPGTPGVVGTVGGYVGAFTSYLDFKPGTDSYSWKAKFSVLSNTGGVFQSAGPSVVGGSSRYVPAPALIQGKFNVHGYPFVPTGT